METMYGLSSSSARLGMMMMVDSSYNDISSILQLLNQEHDEPQIKVEGINSLSQALLLISGNYTLFISPNTTTLAYTALVIL